MIENTNILTKWFISNSFKLIFKDCCCYDWYKYPPDGVSLETQWPISKDSITFNHIQLTLILIHRK